MTEPTIPPGYGYPVLPRPAVAVGGAPLAEAWERLAAYIVDVTILFGVMMIPISITLFFLIPRFTAAMSFLPGETPDFTAIYLLDGTLLAVLLPIQALLVYLYNVTYMHKTGQTIGKRALKIKVVRMADGAALDLPTARKRWVIQFLGSFVPGGFSYANILWLLWDQPYRQCLHDKGAETVVVKVANR